MGDEGAGQAARAPRRRRRVAVVLLLLVAVLAAVTARLFVWPSLPAPPDRADAIIELGGPGDRDAVVLALAQEHRAPLIIQSTRADDVTPAHDCLPAVPGVRVECFHADPQTTRGEARYIGERAAAEGWTSVIIVTTADHAWRARMRVERCFPGKVYVVTSPLPKWDWFLQIPYQWAATAKAELFQRGC